MFWFDRVGWDCLQVSVLSTTAVIIVGPLPHILRSLLSCLRLPVSSKSWDHLISCTWQPFPYRSKFIKTLLGSTLNYQLLPCWLGAQKPFFLGVGRLSKVPQTWPGHTLVPQQFDLLVLVGQQAGLAQHGPHLHACYINKNIKYSNDYYQSLSFVIIPLCVCLIYLFC